MALDWWRVCPFQRGPWIGVQKNLRNYSSKSYLFFLATSQPLEGGSQTNYSMVKLWLLEHIHLFLVSDVSSDSLFIKTHCANTVPSCPKCPLSHHSAASCSKAHHLRCAFAFQKPNGVSHRIFGRYRDAQVNIIRRRVSFYSLA